MYDEKAVYNNVYPGLKKATESLNNALSRIAEIDTSGLTLSLDIHTISAEINKSIDAVYKIASNVESILEDFEKTESDNTNIIIDMLDMDYYNTKIQEQTEETPKTIKINGIEHNTKEHNREWKYEADELPKDFRVTNEGYLLKDRRYEWEIPWYEEYKTELWYTGGYGHRVMFWQSQYGEGKNGATIQRGGCALGAAAVVISEFKKEIIEPSKYSNLLTGPGEGVGDTGVEKILQEENVKYIRTYQSTDSSKTLKANLLQLDCDAYVINLEHTDEHAHWTALYYDNEKEILAQYDPDPGTVLRYKGNGQQRYQNILNGYGLDDIEKYSTVAYIIPTDDGHAE